MSDFEVLHVALLEAMAAGVVPVVRAIESGIPKLLHYDGTGLLVANAPAEAAAALTRLSQKQALWEHCSSQARALVEASYSADYCFGLWEGLFQQYQDSAMMQFPISTANLRRVLPFGDPLFQVQYPPSSTPSSRLHPRRLLGPVKR